MAYCVLGDINALNQQRPYTATTRPTSGQVGSFITQIADEIDGVLYAYGYAVPVTGAKALDQLKTVNALGAAGLAERAAFSVGVKGEDARALSLENQYKDRLKMLAQGTMILVDASRTSSTVLSPTDRQPAAQFNLDTSGSEIAPVFTRDMKF